MQAGVCISDRSDHDGDGYGWENEQSCTVVRVCQLTGSDPDGDGWGWENNRSCVVATFASADPNTSPACIDNDGDGWGWNGYASCQASIPEQVRSEYPRITDVVLITGQSNTLGNNTEVRPVLDDPSSGLNPHLPNCRISTRYELFCGTKVRTIGTAVQSIDPG